MEDFATGMVAMAGAGQYFNNKLVVDQTGLTGSYDFTFKFTPALTIQTRFPLQSQSSVIYAIGTL